MLEDLGVHKEIRVTADPSLLLEPEPLPETALQREGLEPKRRMIGISVREPGPAAPDIEVDHYHRLLAMAADFMVDRLDADMVLCLWRGTIWTSSTAMPSSPACSARSGPPC
ncbi:MAG: hypothetical protein ACREV3_00390 [Gammaproteobacteria bacterium]